MVRRRWLAVAAVALLGLGSLGSAPEARARDDAPTAAGAVPARDAAPGRFVGDPGGHLTEILDRSPAPEFRRFAAPGMAAAADYAAGVLGDAGYTVLRHDRPATGYRPDYAPGHRPSLVRVQDGRAFRTESAFLLEATTPPEGITCTVRPYDQVQRGDCGFVPFAQVSPEWKNVLADPVAAVRTIRERGGVGAVLQGDVAHGALVAVKVRQPLPTVVALASEADLVGQRVRLRVRGGPVDATLHNVLAVRPPADPELGYTLLQAHLDGWFEAAADNAAGAAAVLAAAERLAGGRGGRGLLVALYDGEEWGLLGSKALFDDLRRPEGLQVGECGPVVHLTDLVSVVNLDAPSAVASDVLPDLPAPLGTVAHLVSYRVLVSSPEPTVTALLAATMSTSGVLGLPVPAEVATALNSGMNRTDGKWFHEAGVPVAWPVVGYPEYHTEGDGSEVVDPDDLVRVTVGTVRLVRQLDRATIGRVPGSSLPAPAGHPRPAPCR